jgi:hypothetical protein
LRILPELEAYRDRLMTKAAAWPDLSTEDLRAELEQCLSQTALLDRSVDELRTRASDRSANDDAEASTAHRLAVQEQLRDINAAYVEALRRYLEGRRA